MKKVVLLGDSIRLIGYGKRVEELLGDQCTVWQPETIRSVCWLDNGVNVSYFQDGQDVVVQTEPYRYGRSLVVRVAKITVEQ